MHKNQRRTGLVISAVTILLCLAIAELVGYLWERNLAQDSLGWTLVASRRLRLERHGTVERPYYLFEPNENYLWEGIPVHLNSYGLRTDEFTLPKPENTYRILNIGDSIVFGWEVDQADTYGKQLESMLNESEGKLNYEVINAGVPGWNLESQRNFLLQEGLSYQPDLVLVDITVVNDIYGQGPAVSEEQSVFQWLRDHTYFWPFLTIQTRFLLAKQIGPEAIPVLNPPSFAAAYYPIDETSPVWDKFWAPLVEMEQACEERGIDLIIIAFPTAFQLNSANHPDTPQRVMEERADKAQINYLDMLPIYQQVCDEAADDACEGYENLLFADVWMHPNQLGHQLAAEALYSILDLEQANNE